MTLLDIATLVCTKVNQNEPEDLAAAKLFAARRYEMIWNDQLWKDAVIQWTYTLPDAGALYLPNSIWLPTKQHLILPARFDRVLAARTGTRHLNVQSHELYFRQDFDAFGNQGSLIDFLSLPPAVWDFDFAVGLQMQSDIGDAGKSVSADVLEADDQTLQRTTVLIGGAGGGGGGGGNGQYVDSGSRVDSVTKTATLKKVSFAAGPLMINGGVQSHTFYFYDASGNVLQTSTLAVGASVAFPATAAQFAYDTALKSAVIPAVQQGGTLGATNNGFGPGGNELLAFAIGFVGTTFLTLQPGDLGAARRQRIRLIGALDVPAPTVRVLGKAKPNTFTADNDSTALTGVDNCLLAITEYDMLRRERQFGKAQTSMQEFMPLLEQLKKLEVVQQAHNKRIIPEDGYGNPYDMWSHPPLSF